MDNCYQLLTSKEILAVLDGDEELGTYQSADGSSIPLRMPYLSGPALCEISTKFGLAMQYSRDGGNLSRWMYLKELIEHCIANNKASSLLSFLLGKQQFSKMLVGQSSIEIENIYSVIVSKVINRVNGILYFSDMS